jgi:hypothetical protein
VNGVKQTFLAGIEPLPLDLQALRAHAHQVSRQASGGDPLPPPKPLPVAHQTRLQRRLARRMGAGAPQPPRAKGISMSIWIITALACLVLGFAAGALWSTVKDSLTAACAEIEQ